MRRVAALVVTALAAAGSCTPPAGEAPGAPERVRAIVMPYLTLMPFYIAQEEGFFAEQGLEVEFVRVTRNQDIMAALATGEVDVAGGMLSVNEIALAAAGARVRMVVSLGELSPEHCPNAALVARGAHLESGALQDPERIRDLVFDIDPLIPIGYWTDVFLQRYGLGVDDIRLANLPSPAAVEAFASGGIDVTLEAEPFVTLLQRDYGGVVWERMDAVVPYFTVAMVMYGPRLLDERPGVGERVAVAMLKAIRRYSEGKTPSNLAIVQQGTGLSADLVEAACWPFVPGDARIDPAPLRAYQEWAVAHGYVDRVVADEELFESRFIDHANAELAR